MGADALTEGPVGGQDVWERFTPLWHVMFLATLCGATAVALIGDGLRGTDALLALGLAAGFALWHWLVLARNPQWWETRFGPLTGYWIVATALTAVLVTLSGGYTLMLYGLYPLMFVTLGWWGMVPVVVVTAAAMWAAGGGGGTVSALASAGLAAFVAVFVTAIAQQSEQRREALAALAATRAELAGTARRAGMLAERERLSRELHDTVAQGFTSVVTQLESAEQALDQRPADAREHLEKARRTARDSLGEVRRSVQDLRPDLLDGVSLPEALDRAVRRFRHDTAVPAELRTTGDAAPLPPDTEIALLRVVQEALANAARHAGARRVVVSLSYLGDTVTLDVDDDGTGFTGEPRPRADGGGYGLLVMRERVAAVGGELSVESVPGEGTTIAVSVPA